MRYQPVAAVMAATLILVGCSGLPMQRGTDGVSELAETRGVTMPSSVVADAVPKRVDREAAVRLALQHNPELRSALASLGFGAADVYEAGRLANPVLGLSLLDSDGADGRRLEIWSLVFAFTDALTIPARRRMAAADYAALQHEISAQAIDTAVGAERAWINYAATLARAALRETVAETGIVSEELAERFRRAGNLTPRELAEQRAATAMLRADAIAAEADVATARSALASALGIGAGGGWTLDAGLREPPQAAVPLAPLLDAAGTTRLDSLAARRRADALATRAGVENWSRWLAGVQVGVEREREPDGERLDGPTASIPLPVFDSGRGRMARARAMLAQQAEAIRRIEIDIDNELRAAHARLDTALRRANTYRYSLLPARRSAVDEASAQYNFMLIGVFELLEVKRQEIDAWQGYVDAVADFWRAHADLARAAGRRLPVGETPALKLMPAEAASAHDHEVHGQHDDMPAHQRDGDDHEDVMHDEQAAHDSAADGLAPTHEHGERP